MSEKPKRKRGSQQKSNIFKAARIGIGWAVGLWILVTCAVLSHSTLMWYFDVPLQGHQAISQIERILQLELPENVRDIFYFRAVSEYSGLKFQFSAPSDEILIWLDHPHLCFNELETEYVEIQGWHYFSSWRSLQTITDVATGRCDANWDTLHHYSQHIFVDQTNSEYWTAYFVVYWI